MKTLLKKHHLALFLIFSLIFSACKKDVADKGANKESPTSINQILSSAKEFNNGAGAEKLNWKAILITVSLTDSVPYSISVPVIENNNNLNTIVSFVVNSKGKVISKVQINKQSFDHAKTEDIKWRIADKFVQFKNRGLHIDQTITSFSSEFLNKNSITEAKKMLSFNYADGINKRIGLNKLSEYNSVTSGEQGSCANAFGVQYNIMYDYQACSQWDLEDHRYFLREHIYNEFRQLFSSMGWNLSIDLIANRTVIFGAKSDVIQFAIGPLQSYVQQFIESYHGQPSASGCMPTTPYNISIQDFSSSCSIDPDGGGDTDAELAAFTSSIFMQDLTPCASSVLYSLMYQTDGSVVQMIQKFAGVVPGYNWVVESGGLGNNVNAQTHKVPNGVVTVLDADKYTDGTDIALARTLLHEAVHGYLVVYFSQNPALANLSYPELVAEYLKVKDTQVAHHNNMTIQFIDDIAIGLKEYGNMHGITFPTEAAKNQFYSDMAWGGLEMTPAFQALDTNTKNRIKDTLLAEQYGVDRFGNPKAPVGNPTGC